MNFLTYLAIVIVVYTITDLLIKKTNIHNRLFRKPAKFKYPNVILILILVTFTFSLEYGKQLLNERYGQHNLISTILGGILVYFYINFGPIIFRKNNP